MLFNHRFILVKYVVQNRVNWIYVKDLGTYYGGFIYIGKLTL